MRLRVLLIPLLALMFVAGCGGGGGAGAASGGSGGDDAASLVPAGALAYVTLDTDLGSTQIQNASAVLQKFPIEPKLIAQIRSGLAKDGVDLDSLVSSVGPTLAVAVLKLPSKTSVVGFAKPSDEKAFDAQLSKAHGAVHTTVSGWTVFAESQAFLDAVTNRTASLADDDSFKAAMASIPGSGDAIARAFVSPSAIGTAMSSVHFASAAPGSGVSWIAAALTSQDGTFRLEAHVKEASAPSSKAAKSTLLDTIPSGSVLALSLNGVGSVLPPSATAQLQTLSAILGVDIAGLVGVFDGPVVGWVRAGTPLPEVTLAAKPSDPVHAASAVGGLLAKVLPNQKTTSVTVDGVPLEKIDLGPVALYWGSFDGELLLSDTTAAVSELKGGSGGLADDPVFKQAAQKAGMPDGNQGFVFLNMKDALPMIEGIAQLAGQPLPASVDGNLRPLRSVLLYGTRDGDVQDLVVSVETN